MFATDSAVGDQFSGMVFLARPNLAGSSGFEPPGGDQPVGSGQFSGGERFIDEAAHAGLRRVKVDAVQVANRNPGETRLD